MKLFLSGGQECHVSHNIVQMPIWNLKDIPVKLGYIVFKVNIFYHTKRISDLPYVTQPINVEYLKYS